MKAEEEEEEPATKRAPTLKRDRDDEEERGAGHHTQMWDKAKKKRHREEEERGGGHQTQKWDKANGLSPKPNKNGDRSDNETCSADGAQEHRKEKRKRKKGGGGGVETGTHAPARERADAEVDKERGEAGGGGSGGDIDYPFVVTASADHAESPLEAYTHLAPVLRRLAQAMRKDPENLKIYDPFFCAGTMKEHLRATGFPNVYNRKEDFYQVVKAGMVPEHDVVVPFPPLSLCVCVCMCVCACVCACVCLYTYTYERTYSCTSMGVPRL